MSRQTFLDGRVVLHAGDCLDVIKTMPDASIDAVVTDPPYALVSIQQRFGKAGAAPARSEGATGVYARAASGFMGKSWDTGERAFAVEFWAHVWRVLKPGGHVAAFAGTRTYHRLACAIEDAGFEIRDQLAWVYGSGFPKSHDVSKAIDKAAGAEREVTGPGRWAHVKAGGSAGVNSVGLNATPGYNATAPATEAAAQWQGWGTALKPAWEPICLARKSLGVWGSSSPKGDSPTFKAATVAANVLAHGTGAINIDGCRVATDESTARQSGRNSGVYGRDDRSNIRGGEAGRHPANLLHDGSAEVVGLFPADGEGSAARFFYSAKADADDRAGSKHPTVKPVDLMQWLCRLITPPGGTVLDPFAGTGTTGEAAWREGCRAHLIEREEEYRADIARRMALATAGPATRRAESAKARHGAPDAGPLFGGLDVTGGGGKSSGTSPIRTHDRPDRAQAVNYD